MPDKPDKFDAYREALVMETATIWPAACDDWEPREKARLGEFLHQSPDQAAHLQYIRLPTGFCRRITVTPEDIQRLT